MRDDNLDFHPQLMLARHHGLVGFEAEVLAANAPMRVVFQRSEGGVIHLELDLVPPPA